MSAPECELNLTRSGIEGLEVQPCGKWVIESHLPDRSMIREYLDSHSGIDRVWFDSTRLDQWDSVFLTFLAELRTQCESRKIEFDMAGLPEGVVRLLKLSSAVPEAEGRQVTEDRRSMVYRLGAAVLAALKNLYEQIGFVGEICLSIGRLFSGRARFRRSDVWLMIEECGPRALPIVTLISILVGLILAFVGAVQLGMFGAQIYVANLVGLGMAREMGAMMTAVIMAGRTGAAYAAQLGTMKVNEEIDALKTMGISPMDFLVLPRVIALVLMMPLLCLYADFMGIVGGMIVGTGMLDLTFAEYYTQTRAALAMRDFNVGLFKSAVFGVLVAISGCMRGMESGRSSSAVGEAATNAVVTGIVWIIVSDAILTVIYNALGV